MNIHELSRCRSRIRKFASFPWDGSILRHEELETFGTLEQDPRRSTNTFRLSGMKRVIVSQTNRHKQFHSLHTWALGKTRFVRTRKLNFHPHLWRERGFIPESRCSRGMLPVRMYTLRITTQTLLAIFIFLATFTHAGKNSYFYYHFFPPIWVFINVISICMLALISFYCKQCLLNFIIWKACA